VNLRASRRPYIWKLPEQFHSLMLKTSSSLKTWPSQASAKSAQKIVLSTTLKSSQQMKQQEPLKILIHLKSNLEIKYSFLTTSVKPRRPLFIQKPPSWWMKTIRQTSLWNTSLTQSQKKILGRFSRSSEPLSRWRLTNQLTKATSTLPTSCTKKFPKPKRQSKKCTWRILFPRNL